MAEIRMEKIKKETKRENSGRKAGENKKIQQKWEKRKGKEKEKRRRTNWKKF